MKDEIKGLKVLIQQLKKETKQYNVSAGLHERIIDLQKRTAEQEQYSRKDCVELTGLPEDTNDEDFEDVVVEAFEIVSCKEKKRDFHVVHRSANKNIFVTKLVNRGDLVSLLRNKKN